MRLRTTSIAAVVTFLAAGMVAGQGRGNPTDWPTAYGDAQHTSWIRNDVAHISLETMSQPGFELQWKTTLESPVRQGSAEPGCGHVGSEYLHAALDDRRSVQDLRGRQRHWKSFWTRRFDGTLAPGNAACPGGISGALTRMASLTTPAPGPGRGGGREEGPTRSAVGEPGAGVPPLPGRGGGTGRGAATPPATATAPAGGGHATVPPPAPATPPPTLPPSPFRPTQGRRAAAEAVPSLRRCSCGQRRRDVPNAQVGVGQGCATAGAFHSSRRTLLRPDCRHDMVYTATSQGCGGAANGIWAINASSDPKAVVSWKTNGATRSGRSPSRPTAWQLSRLAQAPSRPADMRTQSSRSIRRRSP